MLVRATRMGYYGHKRRIPGEVFNMADQDYAPKITSGDKKGSPVLLADGREKVSTWAEPVDDGARKTHYEKLGTPRPATVAGMDTAAGAEERTETLEEAERDRRLNQMAPGSSQASAAKTGQADGVNGQPVRSRTERSQLREAEPNVRYEKARIDGLQTPKGGDPAAARINPNLLPPGAKTEPAAPEGAPAGGQPAEEPKPGTGDKDVI